MHLSRIMRKPTICICETKDPQVSFAITAKLISASVFATWIVQSLYFLNLKFPASSHLQWLYSLDCVRSGQNPHCWFSPVATHLESFKQSMRPKVQRNNEDSAIQRFERRHFLPRVIIVYPARVYSLSTSVVW